MKIHEIIILGLILLIIVGLGAMIISPNQNPPTSTTPSIETTTFPEVEPTEPMESIGPTSLTTPPIPDSVIDNALQLKFEYIPGLSKDDNVKYRIEITKHIVSLWKVLADMDWRAENYCEASNKILNEIERLNELDRLYRADYEEIIRLEQEELAKWQNHQEEYPVATEVWLFLKNEMGYSDAVCAGIIGNMMAECGGQTLKLKWNAVNKKSGCYGLCQWHPKYYPELQNTGLSEQLEHMKTSLPKVLSRYLSICYKKGFTYEDFLALEDPAEVAYAFCLAYERPGPGSYNQRMKNAEKAYEYFVLNEKDA
jgi:hypothetical protein